MTILEAQGELEAKRVSSVELTRQSLALIARHNPRLNAFITVMEESALDDARAMDAERGQGRVRGPLHGIPVALKDLFFTRGVRTTNGSKVFAGFVPDHDAAVVERLRDAGAVIVGKAGQHELAYGITSNNAHFGAIRNPWDPARIPGGSSGGSGVAVAAGMVFMAMGTDTGGSIRIPASFCGTSGIKPTFGRVSRYGAFPLGFTLDHMGPLTRTVRDSAVTLQALAGYDARDESSSREPVDAYLPPAEVSIQGVRVGIPRNFYYDRLDPDVERGLGALAATAAKLGAEIVPVTVPDMEAINAIARVILLSEATAALGPYLERREDFSTEALALLDQGRVIAAPDYVNAQRLRRIYTAEFSKLWKQVDCLLAPSTPNTAPRIGQAEVELGGVSEDVRLATTRFARAINLLGVPALSLPCGLSTQNLPVGAQLIAKPFAEKLLFRVGAALEDAGTPMPAPPLE